MSSNKYVFRRFEHYTWLAVLATLNGYIMQFIGSRGMQAWIFLAQLVVTVLMSVLRGLLRTQRLASDDNELNLIPDMVAGLELDWFASRLDLRTGTERPQWHLTGQHEQSSNAGPRAPVSYENPLHRTSSKSTHSPVRSELTRNIRSILSLRVQLASLTGLHSFGKTHDEHQRL
jgi:hypothetical protein